MNHYLCFDSTGWSIKNIDPFAGTSILVSNQHTIEDALRAASKMGIKIQVKLEP